MSTPTKAAVLLALLATAAVVSVVGPAQAAPRSLSPYHQPPWLVTRGRPLTLAYALLDPSATGSVYVRSDLQKQFTRLPLAWGRYCPGDARDAAAMQRDKVCGDALLAHVPGRFTAGSKLFYYAVLREGDRSATVPSAGGAAPQRVWAIRAYSRVALGAHHFGHLEVPDGTVAQAGPADVGLTCCADPPGGDGPPSLDVARDGSVWVLDRLRHRLLVWRPGGPSHPAQSVSLPQNLSVSDFALGPQRTIYARAVDTADLGRGSKSHLYALTATGRVRWQAPTTSGISTAQLQMGPDGRLYAASVCGETCAPFGANESWTPLTTRSGQPLTLADRRRNSTPFQTLPGALRLVSELSYSIARFALVDRSDHVVRAWEVTSRTRLGAMRAAAGLVGGDLVVPLQVTHGPRSEQLILRLGPAGARQILSVPDRPVVGEMNPFLPLRVAADGSLYELQTSIASGATVARYSLAPSPSPQLECGG